MDYGHDLRFGSFLTPTNRDPAGVIDLAVHSEAVGLDLVTFQDHPYQPSFLDTWTLMSWVGARTERIHLSPNVLNVPMRPPAVTARAAASLDLLTGGRVALGLGAGAFWDAMEAMGVDRLTPGQAVDALGEAIAVIRALWDDGERRPLVLEGRYHRLHGAKRGPAPAHRIPIWLGAYKPRMLRLTGRAADGWLPSLTYLQPGQLAEGNRRIDDAAAEAGRDPREIRRLLNVAGSFGASARGPFDGPAASWAEELTRLALEEGASAFILASDDPRALRIFGEEVAPLVREAVDRERRSLGTASGEVRSTAALAKRRDGIAYDDLPDSLRASAVEPGDPEYGRVRSNYMRGGSPGLVLRPETPEQVAEAVGFARTQPVPLGVRSGGHGISGRSTNDGGIVIDVGRMNAIEILDEERRRVRVGAGARWQAVAAALEPHGWALTSGDYGGVGVGGLATAGGIGWLAREHGLTIDHVRAVEMVLADGRIVRADETHDEDLFWAVRGAGANFGVVTAFEFEADEIGEVGFAQLVFDASDTAAFLEGWGRLVEDSPRDLTSFLILGPGRRGQPPTGFVLTMVDSADPDTILERLQPFAALGPLLDQSVQLTTYASVMANASPEPHSAQGEPLARSGFVEHLTPEFAALAAELLASGETHFFSFRSVGGAVSDVPEDATAYAHRSANFAVSAMGSRPEALDRWWRRLAEHHIGLYLSFETDLGLERLGEAFPERTLARLRELKHRYDPDNVFRDNFNIAPQAPPVASMPDPAG